MRGTRSIMTKVPSISSVLAFVVALACSTETTPQGPAEPEPATSGALELTVEVTGTRPDADGYDVSISLATQAVPLVRPVEPGGGTLQISELPVGTHFLRVQGLAHPCRIVGSQPFAVTIEPGATTRLKVSVSCPGPGPAPAPSGTLELRVTGHDAVTLRGYRALMQISGEIEPRIRFSPAANITISALPPGTHSVRVEPLTGNCLAGNAGGHPFSIVAGETTTIELVASCSAVYGALAGSYEREILNGEPHSQSERYVLLADGSFRLRYQTSATHSFEYPGVFYQETGVTGTVLTLLFTGYVGRGVASARVVGDCLEVEYNVYLLLTDFAPGRFCRQ